MDTRAVASSSDSCAAKYATHAGEVRLMLPALLLELLELLELLLSASVKNWLTAARVSG